MVVTQSVAAQEAITKLLSHARRDEAFTQRLIDAPLATMRAEGHDVDLSLLKRMLGIPAASDAELDQELRRRFPAALQADSQVDALW